jgi:hypothetical protein
VYDTLDDFDTRLSNTYLWRRRELGGLSGVGGGKKNRFLVCMCWEVTPVPSTPPSNRILNVSVADRALYCSWRVKCLSLTPFQLQPSICLFVFWEGGKGGSGVHSCYTLHKKALEAGYFLLGTVLPVTTIPTMGARALKRRM